MEDKVLKMLIEAEEALLEVRKDEKFLLKDLFKGLHFSRLLKSERIVLGISFSSRIKEKYKKNVIILEEKHQNHLVYQMIEPIEKK